MKREKLRDLNAVPAKDILRNKARVCPPVSAICEIMDNIFDNYEENGESHDLAISIVVNTGMSKISIAENSGGVREAKLEPLVRLGVPYHGAKGSIGTWGEGLKVALFSLGSEVEILTSYKGEAPVAVHFEQGWLDSPDWSVPLYKLESDILSPGSTEFHINQLERKVDWAEVMREVAVIYGHKIKDIQDRKRRVRIDFEVDGSRTTIKPRALASIEFLRSRLSFPPDFSPRTFTAEWRGEHGPVKCHLIVGLTARHSGETSGVYMYGNGRLFARALRTRSVGYGESGNAVLRDHPSCWRIHAYAFFEADNGSDIPWQAPLKDGVSENHPVTAVFKQMFKETVLPYSRFAKTAKASELVPYTMEWGGMTPLQKADVLFGKHTPDALDRFRHIPPSIGKFEPPFELENLMYDGVACDTVLRQLDDHAKYARQVIAKRDADPELQEDVLRALNPHAFAPDGNPRRRAGAPQRTTIVKVRKLTRVVIEISAQQLEKLQKMLGTDDSSEAVLTAVRYTIKYGNGQYPHP
jgi:hypothetical protein